MTKLSFVLFFVCLFGYSSQRSTPEDASYVAATVEFEVRRDSTDEYLQRYIQHIEDAIQQDADIIVFPEMTLSGSGLGVSVPIYGDLALYPIPALRPDLYDEVLVNISAAARQHEIYVVINVNEEMNCTDSSSNGEYCPEEIVYYFNTNVVFDRTGAVIDRYRKINLFGERSRFPALQPDLGVFSTDFGVTFGHFICFDLQFQVPAIQVVEKMNITDVIFPTMWFSELPYLTAVEIQEAYAYSLNINFIASGANNVGVGSAGSGIYSGKAGALVSIMPGLPTSRLLVSRVPKVPGEVNFTYPGPIYDNPADHDGLYLIRDPSLPSHVTRVLVQGFQEFTLVDKEVSCKFRVRLEQRNGDVHYKYRAAAFSGIRSYSGVETGGTRNCAVFACSGDTIDTCGVRFSQYVENSTAIFEELHIEATVPTPQIDATLEAHDSAFFPIALQPSIMPLEPSEYEYEVVKSTNETVYHMTLKNVSAELYTFAVWGRVFEWDKMEASPPIDQDLEDQDLPGSSNVVQISVILLIGALLMNL